MTDETKSSPDPNESEYVGYGAVYTQAKFTRGLSRMGVIEDVVINDKFRGKGYGKTIIACLKEVSVALGCYKCILYCEPALASFYESLDFKNTGVLLSKYFD